ncbi:MAG: hypothetical protein LUM44_15520 [Pyrinomonadaceae bacterium]|nr:hypothetical protein [Pyrinomonadaceae bacterium]
MMNSKVWIRKALSMCMMVAVTATYSMVALANTGKIAGEILVSGKNINGEAPFVKVNGEDAKSGRSIFTSSTIVTPENANAVINLGKAGKIELAPNTNLALNFDEKSISVDLSAGKITVLGASESVNVKTLEGKTLQLKAGETATAAGKSQDDDDDDDDKGGAAWIPYVLIFGGAVAGVVVAATLADNETQLGGGTTVVSPNR